MFAQAGHTVQSLPETNYCHSDTEKKKKIDVNIKLPLPITPSRSSLFPVVHFCPCFCIVIFLPSHPPWWAQPLSSHILFSYISIPPAHTSTSKKRTGGRMTPVQFSECDSVSKGKQQPRHEPTFSLYPAWVAMPLRVAILGQETPRYFCSAQHHQQQQQHIKKKNI